VGLTDLRGDLYRPVGAGDFVESASQGVALGWLVNAPLALIAADNLALTLIMLGKLEEARQILAASWRLNTPPHANTTPRIAFLRQVIDLREPLKSETGCRQVKFFGACVLKSFVLGLRRSLA